MSFLRQKVLFLYQKCAIIMSEMCQSNVILMSWWNHFGVILVLQKAPFQCHCREFSKYLVISDWLKHCQKCAFLAVRSLAPELRHVTPPPPTNKLWKPQWVKLAYFDTLNQNLSIGTELNAEQTIFLSIGQLTELTFQLCSKKFSINT